jgi:uncharacterized cupin superfamily protein
VPAPTISNAGAGEYTPFAVNGDRDPFGALHLLAAVSPTRLTFGMWRCPPLTVELTNRSDEGVYVVSGELTLEIDGGPPAHLSAGDLVLVLHGSNCRYTIVEEITAVFASSPAAP